MKDGIGVVSGALITMVLIGLAKGCAKNADVIVRNVPGPSSQVISRSGADNVPPPLPVFELSLGKTARDSGDSQLLDNVVVQGVSRAVTHQQEDHEDDGGEKDAMQ